MMLTCKVSISLHSSIQDKKRGPANTPTRLTPQAKRAVHRLRLLALRRQRGRASAAGAWHSVASSQASCVSGFVGNWSARVSLPMPMAMAATGIPTWCHSGMTSSALSLRSLVATSQGICVLLRLRRAPRSWSMDVRVVRMASQVSTRDFRCSRSASQVRPRASRSRLDSPRFKARAPFRVCE